MNLNKTSTRSQINHRILVKLIKKTHFGGKNGLFKIKNRPVKKKSGGHKSSCGSKIRTTFSGAPNSGLTIGQTFFVAARLNLCYLSFGVIFFLSPFFDCGPVFRGDIQQIEKNLLDFQMQNFMLNLLNKKKYLKTFNHLSPYYYMYTTCKISHTKKCMPAKLLLVDLFWKFHIYHYCQ